MEGELQRVFGDNVRKIRKARGLSQEELAEALGIHRTYVGGLERGERNITLRTAERLSDALGVDPITMLTKPQSAQRAAADGEPPTDTHRAPGRRPRPS